MRIWPEKTVDQEFADLAAAGHFGSLNDRQFSYLRSQGLTGGLADMMFQWRSGGGGSAPATPILDTVTGAGAAYSTRLLRTAYAGAAIRVRESGGNTEADIGFDSNGDLDTAALLSHCGSNDGYVTTWYDQTTNARHVTQATTTSQPRIVNAGTVDVQNSVPSLFFNGTSHILFNSSPFMYAAGAATIMLVASGGTQTDRRIVAEGYSVSTTPFYAFQSGPSLGANMGPYLRNDAGSERANASIAQLLTSVLDSTLRAIVMRDSGTQFEGFNNGVNGTNRSYTRVDPTTLNRFAIGGLRRSSSSNFFSGSISEVILFPSAISNADMNAVGASQGEAYGITVSPFLTPVEKLAVINGTGDGGESLGFNLEGLNDFREPVYIDRAHQGRGWLNGTDFAAIPSANLTADGELASLPAGQTQAKFFFSSLTSDPAGTRAGRFQLSFTGAATVSFTNAGTNVTTIDANTYEFDCDYLGDRYLTFTPTSFPIKVSIVKTSDLTAHAAGQYFRQEFLDFIPSGSVLRFMNAMGTNSSAVADWADYPPITGQTWELMPFLAMIDLCNQKSAHPWFCVPHLATDDFVTQMATTIRDNLDSGLRARIELSNEIWNFSINTAGNYFEAQALSQWGTSGGTNWLSAAGKRFVEIMTIFNTVFAGQTHRIIGVLAGQSANTSIAAGMLDAPNWLAADPSNYVAPYTLAKEWAIAPYIGWAGSATTATGDAIKTQLDISQAAAATYIKGLFPNGLATSKSEIDGHTKFAADRNLRLTMYEYNNHFNLNQAGLVSSTLYSGGNPVAGALDAFIEATYSAEMADALDELRDYFKAQNGSQMVLYKGPSGAASTGTWGVVRYIGESPDPATHAAWRAWHAANGRWWAQ